MKDKTAELFYNKKSLGIVFNNLPDKIVPLVTGNGYNGNVILQVTNPTPYDN